MYYGETKFRELLDRLEKLIESKTQKNSEKIEDQIKDTKLKLVELFMLRYDK